MRDVAAGVVDVGLDQHGIARGLVDLDSVASSQKALELGAIEGGGAAYQRQPRRIEAELKQLRERTALLSSVPDAAFEPVPPE